MCRGTEERSVAGPAQQNRVKQKARKLPIILESGGQAEGHAQGRRFPGQKAWEPLGHVAFHSNLHAHSHFSMWLVHAPLGTQALPPQHSGSRRHQL